MNVKKTKKFKENRPENYHVHDSPHRPSILLTLSILRTKNAYSNFKGYVALRRGYHYCTSLVLLPRSPVPVAYRTLVGPYETLYEAQGQGFGVCAKKLNPFLSSTWEAVRRVLCQHCCLSYSHH